MTIPIEQRECDHAFALQDLVGTAERWLEARAKQGARMPRKFDDALDLAMGDVRRSQRRLDEARKRVARAA